MNVLTQEELVGGGDLTRQVLQFLRTIKRPAVEQEEQDIESILMTDDFWRGAFRPDDPFHGELLREFRRGVILGGSSDLAWGRIAVYSLSDHAIWPVVGRLLHFANADPSAEFVESLIFFLSTPDTLARMRADLEVVSRLLRDLAAQRALALQVKLHERNDADLSDGLGPFIALLNGTGGHRD